MTPPLILWWDLFSPWFLSVIKGCSGCCAKKNKFIEKFLIYQLSWIEVWFWAHSQAVVEHSYYYVHCWCVVYLDYWWDMSYSTLPSASVHHSVLAACQKTNIVKGSSSEHSEGLSLLWSFFLPHSYFSLVEDRPFFYNLLLSRHILL